METVAIWCTAQMQVGSCTPKWLLFPWEMNCKNQTVDCRFETILASTATAMTTTTTIVEIMFIVKYILGKLELDCTVHAVHFSSGMEPYIVLDLSAHCSVHTPVAVIKLFHVYLHESCPMIAFPSV